MSSVTRLCAGALALASSLVAAEPDVAPPAASAQDLLSPREEARGRELVLLNWADYIAPELVTDFEAKFSARVKQVYFEGDEARESLLAKSDGRGYDLVLVNGARLDAYRRAGWLAPLTLAEVPNLGHVDPRWVRSDGAEGYAVPYTWGTTGIAYRSDLVDEPIVSWRQFYRPSEALRGKISLVKASRDVIGMALKALGYSLNSEDPRELGEAQTLLHGQRPYVKTYSYVDLDEHSQLVTGEVTVAMMYSGDALMVAQHVPSLVYVVPEEGGGLWVDYLVVMESSPNKKLAADFINFLNVPENAARLAQFLYYATPNLAAEKLLPEEFLKDPTIYPSPAVLQRSEFPRPLSPRATRRHNQIFEEVASARK
jgi:spermidine/putrescine transport system substrate-binding protein